MQIVRVAVVEFFRPLDGKAWNPAFRWRERRAPLLIVETEDGVRGIGEAWSRYTDCRSVLDYLARTVAPAAVGLNFEHPRDVAAGLVSGVSDENWVKAAALSALDMALWDAWSRARGVPLWQALGGSAKQAPAYASGCLYRDDYSLGDLQAEVGRYREAGFTHVKMKIGGIAWEDDLLRVRGVREAVGPQCVLWADGVNQLKSVEAQRWAADLRAYDVAAVQSPVPVDDVSGMAHINRLLPVIASEAEYRHHEFARLLAGGVVTHLQFCLTLCGGISGGLALDDAAALAGVTTTPQCFSTIVAQAATLHFAAGRRNVVSAEYHRFHDHLQALAQADLGEVADGFASAGSAPGLGVAIPQMGGQDDGSTLTEVATFS